MMVTPESVLQNLKKEQLWNTKSLFEDTHLVGNLQLSLGEQFNLVVLQRGPQGHGDQLSVQSGRVKDKET